MIIGKHLRTPYYMPRKMEARKKDVLIKNGLCLEGKGRQLYKNKCVTNERKGVDRDKSQVGNCRKRKREANGHKEKSIASRIKEEFFKYIRNKSNHDNGIGPLLAGNGRIITHQKRQKCSINISVLYLGKDII